ncbi:MAG: hypothetical protein KBD24_01300 [Candidatus Pacebacteria bacterium]|nr:hypothetical protein [Candidatus Paceibacterota bacterium]
MEQSFTPYQPASFIPEGVPQSPKIGKFKASRMIVSASWNMLKEDKEMLLFPILSGMASTIASVILVLAYVFVAAGFEVSKLTTVAQAEAEQTSAVVNIAFLLTLYITTYFIATFFQAGIVTIAHGRINGRDLAFRDGMNVATAHIGKIFLWSTLSATVGLVLRLIAERSKLLGRIVIALVGAAWSIVSYFIVPVLILEELSVVGSLKKSAETIKRSWGETAIVNIGVGLFFFILTLLGMLVLAGLLFTQQPILIFTGLALFLVYVLALSVISSTLNIIFKVVLYEYVTKGTVPQGFSDELLHSAFKVK